MYHKNSKRLIYAVACISLSVIACGMQVQPAPVVKASDHLPVKVATATNTPRHALVCMAGTLNFRIDAGTDKPVIASHPDGYEIDVLAGKKVTEDGAIWLETSEGWANRRYICEETR